MKNLSLLFIIITMFSRIVFADPFFTINSQDELVKYIQDRKFNGVILVAKNQEILYRSAFGYKDFINKIPLLINDKFQIGSLTKQFIAASILKLQERGLISLEDKITKYLPELTKYSDITLKQILTHTSGIPSYTDQDSFYEHFKKDPTLIHSLDEIINYAYDFPSNFTPESDFKYCNTGYILAGKIVEVISGKTWSEFIADEFLKPLKMNETGYAEEFKSISDVKGYTFNDKEELFTVVPFYNNLTWASSAGALYSTVDDLLKWTQVYKKSEYLSSESQKVMQVPFLNNYGLGISVKPFLNDILISHSGGTFGFVSELDYLKNNDLTVAVLDNIEWYHPIYRNLMEFYAKGVTKGIKINTISLSSNELKEFEGAYEGILNSKYIKIKVFLQENQLCITSDIWPTFKLRPVDKDSFELVPYDGLEFQRNSVGEITSFKLDYGGEKEELIFKKQA